MARGRDAASPATMRKIILAAACVSANAAVVDVSCAGVRDAATINEAIADSAAGDEVRLHGTCDIEATIVLAGDRTYGGDSRTGTILRQANNTNLDAVVATGTWAPNVTWTGTPVRLAHFTVDGNAAAGNANSSCVVVRSWMTVVEDLHVHDCGREPCASRGGGVAAASTRSTGRADAADAARTGRGAAAASTDVLRRSRRDPNHE